MAILAPKGADEHRFDDSTTATAFLVAPAIDFGRDFTNLYLDDLQ
jgi:hypothetical protein